MKKNKFLKYLAAFVFVGLLCSFKFHKVNILKSDSGICEMNDGILYFDGTKYVSMGDEKENVLARHGEPYSIAEDPGGVSLYYKDDAINVYFNSENQVYLFSVLFMQKEKGKYEVTRAKQFKTLDLIFNNSDIYLDVCKYLKENNINYTVGEMSSIYIIDIKLVNGYKLRISFLKEKESKIHAIQCYKN